MQGSCKSGVKIIEEEENKIIALRNAIEEGEKAVL